MSIRSVVLLGTVAVVTVVASRAYAQDAAVQQLLQEADKYYDQGEYDRAASNFDRAIRSQPKDVPSSAYAKRASIFLFAKRYGDGLTWIDTVAQPSWPDDDLILEQKAVMLSRVPGKKADAVELAERVVKRRGSSYTLQSLLGDHYYLQGAPGAAATASHYEAYLKSRPSDIASQDGLVRVKLGFAYLHLGRYGDAEKQLDEAVRGGGDPNIASNARKGLCAAYAGGRVWDRAVTMCERVIEEKRATRGDPSPQFNVGQAYLHRERLDEAMRAADGYVAARPKEPKGYVLRAQVLERRGKYPEAEAQLNQAETLAPADPEVARELGRVYLKGKRAGKAIEKLLRAVAARPDDAETIAVLAEAYLADGNGASAATQATKGLAIPGQEKNVQLLGLAGEGFYAAGQLREARSRFERGLAISKEKGGAGDARITGLLVDTINRQAAERWGADDVTGAERLLLEAQTVDPENTRTAFNLGLVAENRGDHETAIKYLSARLARIPGDLVSNRIIAKAYLGMGDEAKAAEAYARAATDAAARRNLTVLAEVYTEWAPLILKSGKAGAVDDAVDKLEQAAQYARGQPFERATKRNLVVAYFRRGYERLRSRRGSDAIEDLEAATKDATLLTGNEPEVFGFALGLAYLDGGQTSKAAAIFQGLSRKGNLSFLKPPFDAVGADFFNAYTLYRDSSPSAHTKAAPLLERLAGKTGGALGTKVKELSRSNWEQVAYDANNRGQGREADVALRKASALGSADRRPQIEHNQAVLDADKNPAGARATFGRLTDRVPEALINLGILADREGDAKAAFDAWSQARTRGARSPRLDEWLDTKKRLFGY